EREVGGSTDVAAGWLMGDPLKTSRQASTGRPALFFLQSGPSVRRERRPAKDEPTFRVSYSFRPHCELALPFAKGLLNPQLAEDRSEWIRHLWAAEQHPPGDCRRARLRGNSLRVPVEFDWDSAFASR